MNCHCSILPKLEDRRIEQASKLFQFIASNNRHLLHADCPEILVHSRKYRLSYLKYSRSKQQFFPFMAEWLNNHKH